MIRELNPDVLHGHGAKAGAFMRLRTASRDRIRVYTPHGGSLHYPLSTLKGNIYARVERALMNDTDLFLFESAFARNTYQRTIGTPKGLVKCVFNGVTAGEFDPVVKADDATDLIYVGEFRHIKGADLLIDAVAKLRAAGQSGDADARRRRRGKRKPQEPGGKARPWRSRAVHRPRQGALRLLQGLAAGRSLARGFDALCRDRGGGGRHSHDRRQVGGIPEIFGEHGDALFAPSNTAAMADAIEAALKDAAATRERAKSLRERIFMHFSQKAMVEGVFAGYREAFGNR